MYAESSKSQRTDEGLERILIVGGGCFGLSTAYELIKGRYAGREELITVLDRSSTPPALDAASSDYNKIVRQDYCDETWAKLASIAIREWSTPEWAPYFAQSGVLVLSQESHALGSAYVRNAYNVNCDPSMALDGRLAVDLPTSKDIKKVFGNQGLSTGGFKNEVAYLNPQSGWAHARKAMDMICDKVRKGGVNVIGGEVDHLVYGTKNGKTDVTGVKVIDGKIYKADKVILATGSWTAKFLPDIGNELLASGQAVAHIQLTPEEAKEYAHVPVVFRMDTGFYCFPPTPDGVFKFAIHGPGWINPTSHLGHPIPSIPKEGHDRLPQEAVLALKLNLANTYPELAKKEWFETRLCWYCESPSSDWLLDYHPSYPSLFVAAGDSGHAFKFLPTIGALIVQAMDRDMPSDIAHLFSWSNLTTAKGDPSRGGVASFERKTLVPQSRL